MSEKDNTKRVLDIRTRLERLKGNLAEARAQTRVAEDQLSAADDDIRELGLDPDRDLERQVTRLYEEIVADVEKREAEVDEIETILAAN